MDIAILIVVFAAMWMLLIVPQRRQLRRHQELVASLEIGDEVITSAGIYGKIVDLDDETMLVEVAPDVRIRMSRASVARVAVEEPESDEDRGEGLSGDEEGRA